MKLMLMRSCLVAVLLMVPAVVSAQIDQFGTTDTVYADVAKVNEMTWTITVSYTNDESVVGLSIPLKLSAGTNRIVADSAIYTGGRVENFAFKGFRPDTAIQCVTLGMIANMGPTRNRLMPGEGRLVTIFVSSLDGDPIVDLVVDTTTTNPNNSLMTVADDVQGEFSQDTIPVTQREKLEIHPAFLMRKTK